jgi:class 3 adenylate cyclase
MDEKLQFQSPEEQRRYDEVDAQKVLNLAIRLQHTDDSRIDEGQLSEIAEEAGVKPEYLKMAMGIVEKQAQETQAQTLVPKRRRLKLPRAPKEGLLGHIWKAAVAGILGGVGLAILGFALHLDALAAVAVGLAILLGVINCVQTRKPGWGALAGLTWGAAFAVAKSLYRGSGDAEDVFMGAFVGSWVGLIFGAIGSTSSANATFVPAQAPVAFNPTTEDRQDLLKQLYTLQDRLRMGTREATFLSVDVVGSTNMKAIADPLAVEYTFGAYHRFVAQTAQAFGGSVHSTAGDGVTCAFDHPEKAYQAARTIQRNIHQFNQNQNRLGAPFVLRCGLHTGTVVAPTGDLRGVEFAHVIDQAAHLQKAAAPGAIVLSDTTAEKIVDPVLRLGLSAIEVDGQPAKLFRAVT